MCGIAGIAGFRDDNLVVRMTELLCHRGPDDYGHACADNISLGMRRLSIIDLEHGHQPMHANGASVSIVYNGEVYNFRELRQQLEQLGYSFKTNSDTEVVLQGYMAWGLDVFLKLNGMFAVALADHRNTPQLVLARDRFGTKPLYYHCDNERLTFASELKSVLANKRISRTLNPHAVHQYLQLRYVPGNECLFKGIHKLAAASYLVFRSGQEPRKTTYWTVPYPEKKLNISFRDAVTEVRTLLRTSVRRRMIADVPVGAFLSGGVDSSVIVSLMREFNSGELNTFSVGFGTENDETSLARETAAQLGTNHHEIVCSDEDFAHIEDIAWSLDEPIGDAIVLPMYLLARKASSKVKVVLAGEGADEVFGGYLFQKTLLAAQRYRSHVPAVFRRIACGLLRFVPHGMLNAAFEYPAALGTKGKERLVEYLKCIESDSLVSQYRSLISLYSSEELGSVYSTAFREKLEKERPYVRTQLDTSVTGNASWLDPILSLSFWDWLPDDIMMKLDKMTMAHSLEGREPYLDHELVAYVNSLPDAYRIRGWKDKRLLRAAAEDILPQRTAYRKKKPFYIPIDTYFQQPTFRDIFNHFKRHNQLGEIFCEDYLESLSLSQTSLIESKQLFSLIILNTWLECMGKTA